VHMGRGSHPVNVFTSADDVPKRVCIAQLTRLEHHVDEEVNS